MPSVEGPNMIEAELQDRYDALQGRFQELKGQEKLGNTFGTTVDDAENILQIHTGLDVTSEHGYGTPKRFVSMLEELTECRDCEEQCIKWKSFPAETDEMIVVRDLPFVSVCNHHVIPFVGVAHIGYVPNEWEAGLSKFGRAVQHFAKRLQTQERLTAQITDWLQDGLNPKGLIVQLRAEHMCMTVRGVQMPGAKTITTKTLGVFSDHTKTAKMEFLEAIK